MANVEYRIQKCINMKQAAYTYLGREYKSTKARFARPRPRIARALATDVTFQANVVFSTIEVLL